MPPGARAPCDGPAQQRRDRAGLRLQCVTHFGRCFRAAYGLPAREWRRYTPTEAAGGKAAPGPKPPRARTAAAAAPRAGTRGGRKRRGSSGWLEPHEADGIRAQFARVAAQRQAFAADLYQRFFVRVPMARELFTGDLAGQGAKLMRMIALLVARADACEALAGPLAQLGIRHVGYGVSLADYAPMCEALMDTLSEHLAGEFDAEARRNWVRLFERVIALMQSEAKGQDA